MRQVAITGVGLATAVGLGVEATWQGLVEGRSGVGRIGSFDPSTLRTQLGGEIRDFAPEQFVTNRRTLRMMTRNDQLALGGATLPVTNAYARANSYPNTTACTARSSSASERCFAR